MFYEIDATIRATVLIQCLILVFFLSFHSAFSSLLFFSVDEEPVEGALSLALPRLVQMGFIVPDVARTLDEEQKEEALKMGNHPKAGFHIYLQLSANRPQMYFLYTYVLDTNY